MSDTVNIPNSYIQTDLWIPIKTEDCSQHVLAILKQHMKTMSLLYSSNLSTYIAVMNLGLKSKNLTCLTFYKRLPKAKYPNLRLKAAVCTNLFESSYIREQFSY
jgi:hypothetical protein